MPKKKTVGERTTHWVRIPHNHVAGVVRTPFAPLKWADSISDSLFVAGAIEAVVRNVGGCVDVAFVVSSDADELPRIEEAFGFQMSSKTALLLSRAITAAANMVAAK